MITHLFIVFELFLIPNETSLQRLCFIFFRTFNTSSLFCDCSLSWLPLWLRENNFEHAVVAKCAHPENLQARNIFTIDSSDFKCGMYSVLHNLKASPYKMLPKVLKKEVNMNFINLDLLLTLFDFFLH